ncbi:hypothetical protein BFW88_03770 [Pseudomonas fluorescens]|uniref:Uncharacterized protein n=1 Tax=Pseudomonas lactucae TaxID=2813360 RepID=A0A9X0YF35_9PSED|nr:hypothetical protein [Pseudomonas lactucae]MBN2977996.1 hypothetical protein [Pseudomonas lactucae]OPA97123.1 hypothetical protein BFW88_03770 [Pseudomonas fluorescens]OPB13835.1 hypothetical protein BFW92_03745 [Pseudomonas fluorescens]OPB27465.1 hypothetical protein BFW93_03765 [Pseudomonas fluorescens]
MALPLPTLNPPATGAGDQGTVAVAKLTEALELSVPSSKQLPQVNGSVYAMICERPEDPEDTSWSGSRHFSIDTGEYRVAPGESTETWHPFSGLMVKIPKEALEPYAGNTIYVGYSSSGESGPNYSDMIALTVTLQ